MTQLQAQRETADVKIMQKVNAVHRAAFSDKYPGQVEHCLRLVLERLQAGLDKRDGVDPGNPDSWRLSAEEIVNLAAAAEHLHSIRLSFSRAGS